MSGIPSDSDDEILFFGLLALGSLDTFPPALEKLSSSDDEDDDEDGILLLGLFALGLLDAFLPTLEKLSSSDDDDNDDDNDDGLFFPCMLYEGTCKKRKKILCFNFIQNFF